MFELLDVKEYKRFWEWNNNHKCVYTNPLNQGAIGGRLTFKFTPTGLGIVKTIECACGEEIDVTKYEDW